jgi:hypothetical protein
MSANWYYSRNNEREGPITPAQLKQLASKGWLTPDDLVWKEGMPNWLPARKVRGLFESRLVQQLTGTVNGVVVRDAGGTATQAQPTAISTSNWPEQTPRKLSRPPACGSLCAAGSLCRRMRPTVPTSRPLAGWRQTRTSAGVISCFKTHRPLRSARFHGLHRSYEAIRLLPWLRTLVVAFSGPTVSGPTEISWGKNE